MNQKTTMLQLKMDGLIKAFVNLSNQHSYYQEGMKRAYEAFPQLMEIGAITQIEKSFNEAFDSTVQAFEEFYDDAEEKISVLSQQQLPIETQCDADKATKTWWREFAESVSKRNGSGSPKLGVPPINVIKTRVQLVRENFLDLKEPMKTIAFEKAIIEKHGYNPMSATRIHQAENEIIKNADKHLKLMEEVDITLSQIFVELKNGGLD